MFLFAGEAVSKSLLLAFSVGMNIAIVVFNLVLGLIALVLMARTLSWKRLRARRGASRPRRAASTDACRSRRSIPLVTARGLARPFTYEVEDGVGKGAIVAVPFGRRRARGIVVALEPQRARRDRRSSRSTRVVGQLPPALVDLALWLADYYGSTPARALALVAPSEPKRRKIQAPPGRAAVAAGRGRADDAARAEQRGRGRADRRARSTPGGGAFLLYGATGSGKTEVYLQACAAALERGLGAIVLVPEIALAPQTVGRVRARFGDRVAILHSGLTDAERRDERERIASGEARIVVGARSAVFAPVARARPDRRRRGARRLVQAGLRPALRRAHGRGEARRARGRGRGLRLRDAAAGELGAARAARARRPRHRRAAAGARRRPPARGRLPALGAAPRRAPRGSPTAAARRSCS